MEIRLIVKVEREPGPVKVGIASGLRYVYNHRFGSDFSGEMTVLEEGVDSDSNILNGREIHWQIENRLSEMVYCSRFIVNRKELVPWLNNESSNHIPPEQEEVGVTIETDISQEINQNEILFPFPPGLEPLVTRSAEVGPTSEMVFRKAYLDSHSRSPSR